MDDQRNNRRAVSCLVPAPNSNERRILQTNRYEIKPSDAANNQYPTILFDDTIRLANGNIVRIRSTVEIVGNQQRQSYN